MTTLGFTKMQGLGNDFIVIDGPCELEPARIRELCDRRFGIGADGVLVVTSGASIRMEYWNADGSPAEMCGNGLRCVARYAYDGGLVAEPSFELVTPVGPRRVEVLSEGADVELGQVAVTGHTHIDGDRYHLIDIGNPHAVVFVDEPEEVDVAKVGAIISSNEKFPNGTNVEFVTIDEDVMRLRVWERGVGETLACGSGMVAAAYVATKTDGLTGPIRVQARGGEATVDFRDGSAWLRGPADYVFTGSVSGR